MGTVRMIVKDTDKLSAEEIKELHKNKKNPSLMMKILRR